MTGPAPRLLVRGARQLLTLRGPARPRRGGELSDLGLIPDGAVLLESGLVRQIGPTRRVENLAEARGARVIDATGRVVMPGFVDSHTHLLSGAPGEGPQPIRTAEVRRLALHARAVAGGMARHGSTTIEAKAGCGLDAPGELRIFRMLALLDGAPLDVAGTYLAARWDDGQEPVRYLDWAGSHLLPRLRQRNFPSFADIICDGRMFDLEQARTYLECARSAGFLLKVHTDQFRRAGGAVLGVEQGAVSVDHLEYAGPEDLAALANSATVATLLPGSSFYLGGRYAPARELIASGAAIALASDYHPQTPATYSMQMVVSLACAKLGLTPAEAISAATINAAHALRRADRVGSLEPGKQADLILLNVSDYREIPRYFGVNLVHRTIKRGVLVYEEGSVGPGNSVPSPQSPAPALS